MSTDLDAQPTRIGMARRTLGICLLLLVVVLWTTSNFLGSTIFADKTYPKPFFVTYLNTSFFTMPLFGVLLSRTIGLWRANKLGQVDSFWSWLHHMDSAEPVSTDESRVLRRVSIDDEAHGSGDYDGARYLPKGANDEKLGLKATAKLSFQFCLLWFTANYFAMACLQYTTVSSTTILTSTSGVWTLIFGACLRVEKFTVRKALGVLASLIGIILISRVDLSKPDTPATPTADEGSGTFPHKTAAEIALGDAMAAFSSIMYGVYTIVMKKQVGDESRVNMPLFFGLVGFFNLILMWPGFFILHWTGVELFSFPETKRVWTIVLVNSVASFISDVAWAYAMLLTTPLVVTVGLSLTIPLSLVGQIVLQGQYASAIYWVGAAIVFLSFVVVNHESKTLDDATPADEGRSSSGEYESIPHEDIR
ncbi:uncharacterized protein N7484_009472 [Penicillium longicatenatum]|uniref:uncharacterized protein n=1 Tax=Penicillium longicatenatum TaxID=1561947 RepID=UPI002548A785|nr:uncharacterized protein N7484_009472 [Penicillium longicatenatum]KAJ5636159.1 hypothetical protein N7484_009472 [Penicillium longicatenatum]